VQWPWVTRSRLVLLDLRLESAERRAITAEERLKYLEATFERMDAERREGHLRMLRFMQGLPIFPDGVNAVKEASAEETLEILDFSGKSEHEIDEMLLHAAARAGHRTLPSALRWVEAQKSRIYPDRDRARLAAEDAELREQALQAMTSAVQEGRELAAATRS